jgi:hypothetical protein
MERIKNREVGTCPTCGHKGRMGEVPCWCFELPHGEFPSKEKDFNCPRATVQDLRNAIDRYCKGLDEEKRAKIASLGVSKKPIPLLDYDTNAMGNVVFTQWYHLRRGFCCSNGCQNCGWKE